MAFIASDASGGDFKRVPPGVYIGRCYSLVDLGTQRVEYQGDVKYQHKIQVRWELFGEDEQGNPLTVTIDGVEKPMTTSKRYTLSLSDKARLRQDLVSWRGRDFTDEEAKGFDVSKLIGAYCMINITQSESNGKTYSNVSGLTPLPSALKTNKPAPIHRNEIFNLDEPDWELFDTFHEKLREAICASEEYVSRHGKQQVNQGNGVEDMPEDIPF